MILRSPSGLLVELDYGIAPWVALAWSLGFRTTASCQGEPDQDAVILFSELDGAEEFARRASIPLRSVTVARRMTDPCRSFDRNEFATPYAVQYRMLGSGPVFKSALHLPEQRGLI